MIPSLSRQLKNLLPIWLYDRLFSGWSKEGAKRYGINTFWPLLNRLLNTFISLFVTIYLVRYLGPANYGQLSYAVSFVGLFSIISSLGIDNVLYRELIEHPEKKNEYLGTAFVIKISAGLVASLVTIISAFAFSVEDVSRLIILILSATFIFNAFNVIAYEFQANVEQKALSIASIFVVIILNALKFGVVFFDQGIIYVGLILLLESILYASFFIFIRIRHYGSLFCWRYSHSTARSILIDSWPFIFITVFATIYARIDQIMLKHILDSSAVGLYDAAVRIAEAWLFIPAIIASSLFPAIINGRSTSTVEYKRRLLFLIVFLGTIAILIAIPASLLAKPLMTFIYGATFVASASVFATYVWVGVSASINFVLQYFLIAERRRKVIFFTSLGTMVLNIVLNIILIPTLGITGAALATLISYTVLTIPVILIFNLR